MKIGPSFSTSWNKDDLFLNCLRNMCARPPFTRFANTWIQRPSAGCNICYTASNRKSPERTPCQTAARKPLDHNRKNRIISAANRAKTIFLTNPRACGKMWLQQNKRVTLRRPSAITRFTREPYRFSIGSRPRPCAYYNEMISTKSSINRTFTYILLDMDRL